MNILSLSHTDLDGISAQIVLRRKFGTMTRMNISYGKIDEYLDIIQDFCTNRHPDKVFITDLSFTYIQLKKLSYIASINTETLFYFIDHHPFDEDFSNLKLPNFTIIINKKACATKLTYLYLKEKHNLEDNTELSNFVNYVNGFDIWQEGTNDFKIGFVYNELFWSYQKDQFWSRFKDEYKLRNSDKENYKNLISKKNKLFKKLDESGRIMRFGKRILLIFIDSFMSHVTIDYPGFHVYVIIRSYGGASIRLNNKAVNNGITKNNLVKKITDTKYVDEAGGHDSAFGLTIKDRASDNMIAFSRELITIIDEELESLSL